MITPGTVTDPEVYMFLKSFLSVFTGAFGMIFRVMFIIALCFGGGFCLFSMLAVPFIWDGLIRLGGLLLCAALVYGLLRLGRDKDDDPGPDEFRS